MVVSASERSERAEIFTFASKHTFIFNSLLVNHIYYCPCVLNTDIALFMTSYTDQKTRNFKTYLNDCERAENFRLLPS